MCYTLLLPTMNCDRRIVVMDVIYSTKGVVIMKLLFVV